jgi:hypothetical protein
VDTTALVAIPGYTTQADVVLATIADTISAITISAEFGEIAMTSPALLWRSTDKFLGT